VRSITDPRCSENSERKIDFINRIFNLMDVLFIISGFLISLLVFSGGVW
jgi:hypothetical protein